MNAMGTTIAMSGLFHIVITLFSIYFAWILVQQVKWDVFLKQPSSRQAKLVQVVLSIIIGHAFAGFILDYFNWSQMLKSFVE
jgi:uncharacterized integral membrane protein (TIGR02327 family)